MKILLDLDGVLVDFVGGACKAHGRPNPYAEPLVATAGRYGMDEIWGMGAAKFWKPLKDPKFWEGLEFMPDAEVLLEVCEQAVGAENVCLLTSPSLGSGPVLGKANWIGKRMPGYRLRFLIGSAKTFCAHSGSVLVDDSDHNVDAFRNAGGHAVMVPRAWNRLHTQRHQVLDWVKTRLEVICDKYR